MDINHHLKQLQDGLELLADLLSHRLQGLTDNAPPDGNPAFFKDLRKRSDKLRLTPEHPLSLDQTVLLLTALAPHLQADFFDRLFAAHLPEAGDFPQLGGARGQQFRGFLPTADTVLFLLAGNDLGQRLQLHHLFSDDNPLLREQLLSIDRPPAGEPAMSGRLLVSPELLGELTLGRPVMPSFGADFPATRLTTKRRWQELIVNRQTRQQLLELREWLTHRGTLLDDWGMARVFPQGYRVLFHGPPGTGKTMTASLLAHETGHEVYRIDLSMVVSKYIGETEKNLEKVFRQAANRDWILFFDEADALFGKRTGVRDAHDRYANQEVSYLLQRVEQFPGLVILATNLKSNIDDAFLRRFQSVVHFPKPGPEERLRIWQPLVPEQVTLAADVDLQALSRRYELTGSNIANIMQYCLVRTLARGDQRLQQQDLITAIEREFQKEGRSA